EGCRRLCVRRWYQRGRRAADGRRRRHRHERDLPADQGVRRRLLCPGTPVARSRRPMGREDRQSLPLLAGTPRVRVRPRELTGEVAARCERGGPFCIYFLHCHELRTGNTPRRLATSVRPNPSLHPTRYSGLRPLPRAGELKRSPDRRSDSPLRAYALIVVLILLPSLLAAPIVAEAQQPTRAPRVGFLSATYPGPARDAFRQELRELGWVEGQTTVVD